MENPEIVIIGAGITGLTTALLLKNAGKKFIILEKNKQTGGVMQTKTEKGFTYETGPNSGTLSNTQTIQLFNLLEKKCKPEIANKNSKKRLIWKNNKWTPLPNNIITAIKTPLFSTKDKLKILIEPFKKKGTNPNETIAELVNRRLGNSFLKYAVDPFISGIYAGNPNKLITRFALPKLYNLEQKYGSFIKGAIKKAKEPKTKLQKKATKEIFSVKGGFSKLTKTLTNEINNKFIKTECKKISVKKTENTYKITYTQNSIQKTISTQKIISTVGAYELNNIFPFISKTQLNNIQNLKYAYVILTVVGYNKWNGKKIDAFGGLIPSCENKNILGILFPSTIFSERAPKNGALLSVFLGGTENQKITQKSDNEIKKIVKNEIAQTLNNNQQPDLIKIFRHKHAIAQYQKNSEKRIQTIKKIEQEHKNIHLCGNIKDGIGIANRIEQAFKITQKIIK